VADERVGDGLAPPAAAQLMTSHLGWGIALSAGLAVAEAWFGIALAFYTDWPTSFCITALAALVYFAAAGLAGRR